MFTGVMFIFYSVRSPSMCKPRTGWPTSIGILWKWPSKPTELAGDGEWRLPRFNLIRRFCKWNFSFFKDASSSRLSFYLASPFHIISSLFSHFFLFQNAIFNANGFEILGLFFLRMQFSLVATFFSLVLLISLSWYFHLTISYLTLVSCHFGNQIVFPNI